MGRYPRGLRMRRSIGLTFLAMAFAVVLVGLGAGCGGSTDASSETTAEGARLFNEAGCAGCHSLTAAGARARVGPDLDAVQPGYAAVAQQVRDGGGGMPAFADELSESDIAEIASFVSSATGGSTDTSEAATAAQFAPDDTKLSSCQGQFSCLEQGFGNLAYEEGAKVALAEFDKQIAADPEIERNCHRIAHMIGAAALVRYDGRVGKAFAEGSASCWSGYYHGILERAYKDVGSDELGPVSRAPLLGCGRPAHGVHRIPVRPRPRARPDAVHELRPAEVALRLRRARDVLGPDLVYGRRVHGEHLVLVRDHVEVAPRRRPDLPVQDRRRAAQALLLPHGHVAHPPVRELRLREGRTDVSQERQGVDRDLLPVPRARCIRDRAAGT